MTTQRKTLTLSIEGKLARLNKVMKRKTGRELNSDNVVDFTTKGVGSAIYGKQAFERSKLEDNPSAMPCMFNGKESTYGALSVSVGGRERLRSDIKGHENNVITHQRRISQKLDLILEGEQEEIARLRRENAALKRNSLA